VLLLDHDGLAARIAEELPALQTLRQAVEAALEGKHDAVELALVALLARGHLLIEDVPGVGKTTLARALAKAVGGDLRRVQFTSDLLPSDVLGVSVYDQRRGEFVLRHGPIFANILLADEINRASPRTQSALLEAMNEGQVSLDGQTIPLPDPFFVIATQNPKTSPGRSRCRSRSSTASCCESASVIRLRRSRCGSCSTDTPTRRAT
jgi:MoxR-like ATPase